MKNIIPIIAVSILSIIPSTAQGAWSSRKFTADNGSAICSVVSKTRDGSGMSLLVRPNSDEISMLFIDPKWRLPKGQDYEIHIYIDGEGYRGNVNVVQPSAIAISSLSVKFVKNFIRGNHLTAYVGKEKWNMSLAGSQAATARMLRCVMGTRNDGSNPFR
jgi:hypothetical protein